MKPEDYNLTNWLTEAEIEELNSIIPRPKKNKSTTKRNFRGFSRKF